MRTADPEVGAREISLMPTLQCERCDAYYWDEEVSEALSEVNRSEGASAINDVVWGSMCPECGHQQNP